MSGGWVQEAPQEEMGGNIQPTSSFNGQCVTLMAMYMWLVTLNHREAAFRSVGGSYPEPGWGCHLNGPLYRQLLRHGMLSGDSG